jgi:hypothetical protein
MLHKEVEIGQSFCPNHEDVFSRYGGKYRLCHLRGCRSLVPRNDPDGVAFECSVIVCRPAYAFKIASIELCKGYLSIKDTLIV